MLSEGYIAEQKEIEELRVTPVNVERFVAISNRFTDFILNNRFERACELLLKSNTSTEEIARQSGFGSKTVFYKIFCKKTGMTPGEYRKIKTEN